MGSACAESANIIARKISSLHRIGRLLREKNAATPQSCTMAVSALPRKYPAASAHASRKSAAFGSGSTPPQEQAVQLRLVQLHPCGTAVIALAGASGGFHIAQQRIHFRQREAA